MSARFGRRPAHAGTACALLLLAFVESRLYAGEFRLESASLPAPFVNDGGTDDVIEASAVALVGDGETFLVAHDKAPGLPIVAARGGRVAGPRLVGRGFPEQTESGPKWEGMARDSAGNYYLIGSHSGENDAERNERSDLLRFRLGGRDPLCVEDSSVTRWRVAGPIASALRAEGLPPSLVDKRKVEGLAVRERTGADGSTRRELVIGLREPGDSVRGYAADVTEPPANGAELALSPAFRFRAPAREGVASQLTSLEHVPALGGFLALTATEDDANVFHGNTLWFIDDDGGAAREVSTFEVAMKAEGLAVIEARETKGRTDVRLLIVYDNDAHKTGIPSRFQTVTLVREGR